MRTLKLTALFGAILLVAGVIITVQLKNARVLKLKIEAADAVAAKLLENAKAGGEKANDTLVKSYILFAGKKTNVQILAELGARSTEELRKTPRVDIFRPDMASIISEKLETELLKEASNTSGVKSNGAAALAGLLAKVRDESLEDTLIGLIGGKADNQPSPQAVKWMRDELFNCFNADLASGRNDKYSVLRKMAGVRDERFLKIALDSLKDPSPITRQNAAFAVGRLGSEDCVKELLPLIAPATRDKSPIVREEAYAALAELYSGAKQPGPAMKEARNVMSAALVGGGEHIDMEKYPIEERCAVEYALMNALRKMGLKAYEESGKFVVEGGDNK